MACSNAGDHECWCCNEDEVETDCQQLPDLECAGGEGDASVTNYSGLGGDAKCSEDHNERKGPDEDEDGIPDYYTGGWCRAALYSMDPWTTDIGNGSSAGTQTRTRAITVDVAHGGAECPALTESRTCDLMCPVDCVMSDFSEWSECSEPCGGGTRTRTRQVVSGAENGGAECGATEETEACNEQHCPVDCAVSDFGGWSTCEGNCAPRVPNTAMSMFRGCYQDCSTVSGSYTYDPSTAPMGNLNPISGITRATGDQVCSRICDIHQQRQGSPDSCRNYCRGLGKTIWGMACSNAGDHECWCCNENEVETDCQQLPDLECAGGEGDTSVTNYSGLGGDAKCSADHNERKGPDEDQDGVPDYYTGGWCRTALYSMDPWTSNIGSGTSEGTQTRERTVEQPADHGGAECPNLTESRACNLQC